MFNKSGKNWKNKTENTFPYKHLEKRMKLLLSSL